MNATKLSISLDPAALKLLDEFRLAYGCRNRSQAVALSLRLCNQLLEQQALEEAYLQSRGQDKEMNARFATAQVDGLQRFF